MRNAALAGNTLVVLYLSNIELIVRGKLVDFEL